MEGELGQGGGVHVCVEENGFAAICCEWKEEGRGGTKRAHYLRWLEEKRGRRREGGKGQAGGQQGPRKGSSTRQGAHDVNVLPARLGGGGDVAICWRSELRVHRSEGGNAHRVVILVLNPFLKGGREGGREGEREGGNEKRVPEEAGMAKTTTEGNREDHRSADVALSWRVHRNKELIVVFGTKGEEKGRQAELHTLILPKVSSGLVVSKRMDSVMLSGLSWAIAT